MGESKIKAESSYGWTEKSGRDFFMGHSILLEMPMDDGNDDDPFRGHYSNVSFLFLA
jgi:hypothetical protein